mgnify:FL=1|jgi:hypothetical protein|tara:strand:- start:955 stop:1137 length:183 start_codon:yes stop_codon:yes gene_type:complete
MKEIKFLPEGYRFLDVGEQIKKEDYFWNEDRSTWVEIYFESDTSNWLPEHIIRKNNDKCN